MGRAPAMQGHVEQRQRSRCRAAAPLQAAARRPLLRLCQCTGEAGHRPLDRIARHREGQANIAAAAESAAGHRQNAFSLENAHKRNVIRDGRLRENVERSFGFVDLVAYLGQAVAHQIALVLVHATDPGRLQALQLSPAAISPGH